MIRRRRKTRLGTVKDSLIRLGVARRKSARLAVTPVDRQSGEYGATLDEGREEGGREKGGAGRVGRVKGIGATQLGLGTLSMNGRLEVVDRGVSA